MVENDTIRLLRECDAGVDMGISAIDDVLGKVGSSELERTLNESRDKHVQLKCKIGELLDKYHDDGKKPSGLAQGMSHLKTTVKLAFDDSDAAIAGIMTEGCDMGVKSLNEYLEKYKAADEVSKDIAKKLIALETKLERDIGGFAENSR